MPIRVAGDGAAHTERCVDDLVVRSFQGGGRVGVVLIEEGGGVQVAVAGVAGHGDEQQAVGVAGGRGLDGLLHVGDPLAGDGDIANEESLAAVHHGIGCVQPAVPQRRAGLLILGDPDLGGLLAQHLLNDRLGAFDLGGGAVDVDEHDRVGVEGIAGIGELLQPGDSLAVEPFHRGWDDTACDDRGDGIGGGSGGGERTHQAVGDLGDRPQRDGGLGDDPEGAFGSDEDAEQVRAVVVGAEGGGGAVRQHDLDGHDVVVGDAVLECVRTAGVLDDVARHGGQMRRHGVRREAQSVRGEPLL